MPRAPLLAAQDEPGYPLAPPHTLVELDVQGDDRAARMPEEVVDADIGQDVEEE
jgi:hypothetical protein